MLYLRRLSCSIVLLICAGGCSSAQRPVASQLTASPAAASAPTSKSARAETTTTAKRPRARSVAENQAEAPSPSKWQLPTQCAQPAGESCLPPAAFVRALCGRTAPEVALSMFSKGTPWSRAYLRLDRELWFAGKKLSRPVLALRGEELLVLADRTGGSGLVIGGGSYDALRWDGTCVSVSADEVTLSAPRVRAVATIQWKYLPDEIQDSLLEDARIQSSNRARVRQCRGSGAEACQQAEQTLSQLIAAHVREGGSVAEPKLLGW